MMTDRLADKLPRAHWGKRFVALWIDQCIAIPGYMLMIIPGILLFGFRDSLRGAHSSIGRLTVRQCMAEVTTGEIPTQGKRFARNLTALLLRSLTYGLYPLAELIVSLSRNDGRCVTDLMFGTMIIEDRSGSPLLDQAANKGPEVLVQEERRQAS